MIKSETHSSCKSHQRSWWIVQAVPTAKDQRTDAPCYLQLRWWDL